MNRSKYIALLLGLGGGVLAGVYFLGKPLWQPVYVKMTGGRTVSDVLEEMGSAARGRLTPRFSQAGVDYPPEAVTMLVAKDTAKLELWAETGSAARRIHTYDIQALSGGPGPKLREGDRQVPEGVYRIEGLNPNSSYHLSMKLNYPNAFDLKHARREGRTQPGSNIFIHGKALSIGCLAMGDEVIEELFVLLHDVGKQNVRVLIAPTDPRQSRLDPGNHPAWVGELYRRLEQEFQTYRLPEST